MSNDDKMQAAVEGLERMALHCNSATGDARDQFQRDYAAIRRALQSQQPQSDPDDYTADDLADAVCVRIATMLGVEVDYLDGDGTPYSLTLDAVDRVDRAIRDSGLQYDRDENVFICPQPTPQVLEETAIALWKDGYTMGVDDTLGYVADCEHHGNSWSARDKPNADDQIEVCRCQIMDIAAPSIAPTTPQVPEGWQAKIQAAISRAEIFDDGSDGADAESAQSVVAILNELLIAAPSIAEKPPLKIPERMTIERASEFVTDNSPEDGVIRFMDGWNMCLESMQADPVQWEKPEETGGE